MGYLFRSMPHWFWNLYFPLYFAIAGAAQAGTPAPQPASAPANESLFAFVKRTLFTPEGLQSAIATYGIPLLALIVFVETGLLVGFFLPGDSLLVTAGFVAADEGSGLNIGWMFVILSIAAITGDAVGFWIGSKAGPALFKRDDSLLFKRAHLIRAHEFYERYGGKTIVIARFIPIIRTFAPTVAGAAAMNYRKFVLYNIIGGVGWVGSMLVTGYLTRTVLEGIFGKGNVLKYLHIIIAIVIVLSVLPGVIEVWREKRRSGTKKPA